MVKITRKLWYQKARKNYICSVCGKTISKSENYYKYKSYASQRDPFYGPRTYADITRTCCNKCGNIEYGREKRDVKDNIAVAPNIYRNRYWCCYWIHFLNIGHHLTI